MDPQVVRHILTLRVLHYAHNGRFTFSISTHQYDWTVSGATVVRSLRSTGLTVGGTLIAACDKILKLNDEPLTNAVDITNKFEPVEYDSVDALYCRYTAISPTRARCSVGCEKTDNLKLVVGGGD